MDHVCMYRNLEGDLPLHVMTWGCEVDDAIFLAAQFLQMSCVLVLVLVWLGGEK